MFEEVLSGSVERSGVYGASEGRRRDAKVVGAVVSATRVFVVELSGALLLLNVVALLYIIFYFLKTN